MVTLLSIATALFAGLMMTRLFSRFKLPDVTAYLIAGILAGPFVLGRLGVPGLGFASSTDVEALCCSGLYRLFHRFRIQSDRVEKDRPPGYDHRHCTGGVYDDRS